MLRQFSLLKLLGIITGICLALGILLTPWAAAAMLVAFVGCLLAAGWALLGRKWTRSFEWCTLAAVALVFTSLLPATHQLVRQRQVCARCGAIRHVAETAVLGRSRDRSEELEETALSVWYQQHYCDCPHNDWHDAGGSRVGYLDFIAFRMPTVCEVGCPHGYPPRLDAAELALLEEQYARDPAVCQILIGTLLVGKTPLTALVPAR